LTLDGGIRLRTARWILPDAEAHGTVLLAQGRTEFIEKYYEVIAELLQRGLSVVTFDWRGQGLSSRQLADPLKGHINDFSEFDADIACVVTKVLQEHGTKPYFALAHSMGGNITLRYLRDYPHEFDRAVLPAPMLAVKTAMRALACRAITPRRGFFATPLPSPPLPRSLHSATTVPATRIPTEEGDPRRRNANTAPCPPRRTGCRAAQHPAAAFPSPPPTPPSVDAMSSAPEKIE
jgi:alpha-beta hydrolase superfamily lysophospholipase